MGGVYNEWRTHLREISDETIHSAKAADAAGNAWQLRRLGASCEGEQRGQIGTRGEGGGQLHRLAGAAENQDAPAFVLHKSIPREPRP